MKAAKPERQPTSTSPVPKTLPYPGENVEPEGCGQRWSTPMVQELLRFPTDEVSDLVDKLMRVAGGLMDIRQTVEEMKTPPLFLTSVLITSYAPIKSDLDDADPIFERLRAAIQQSNFAEASRLADGLLQRLYGTKSKTPNQKAIS